MKIVFKSHPSIAQKHRVQGTTPKSDAAFNAQIPKYWNDMYDSMFAKWKEEPATNTKD